MMTGFLSLLGLKMGMDFSGQIWKQVWKMTFFLSEIGSGHLELLEERKAHPIQEFPGETLPRGLLSFTKWYFVSNLRNEVSLLHGFLRIRSRSRRLSVSYKKYHQREIKPCTERETSARTWGILCQKRSLDLFFYFNKVTSSFFYYVVWNSNQKLTKTKINTFYLKAQCLSEKSAIVKGRETKMKR